MSRTIRIGFALILLFCLLMFDVANTLQQKTKQNAKDRIHSHIQKPQQKATTEATVGGQKVHKKKTKPPKKRTPEPEIESDDDSMDTEKPKEHQQTPTKSLSTIERMLRETTDKTRWVDLDESYTDLAEKTGCDIFTVPFEAASDKKCIKYLSDMDNWDHIEPMKQVFDQRTIKFKIRFNDDRISAIVKVPQRSFPAEAMSEVGAYHADRVLQVNRIPPTAWVKVPVKRIVDAALHGSSKNKKMVDKFAKEAGVTTYEQWLDQDFVKYVHGKGLVSDESVGVSVQLFVADVRRFLDSTLSIPYKAHNGSWARWLDPNHPFEEGIRTSIYHLSELATFDYILGNSDRSPNKNNFVVGACVNKCKDPPHPGPPSFVHIDNGMCFYTPQRNPINGKEWPMCIFQKDIISHIRTLTDFDDQMKKRTPKEVYNLISSSKVKACQKRISQVLSKVDQCLEKFDESIVLP
eukprot:TRINITY_DN21166_c0_g1_i1.p1 TRINITY_DN21166_c0_g1~~TRINITY_DN21166_c0_g1_i1.p1  ORF type:complete len:463 (+),score=91.81 TRINITY_DN21166_c0_g1_i1:103-1491(+)